MKNINHTRSSISDDIRNILCSSAFFFSDRRRHTSFHCDWSSDMCSSDLSSTNSLAPQLFLLLPTSSEPQAALLQDEPQSRRNCRAPLSMMRTGMACNLPVFHWDQWTN